MHKKSILVTGAAGMVGSHIVDSLLKEGQSVVAVDDFSIGHRNNIEQHFSNPLFSFHKLNVVEFKKLEKVPGEFSCILHLAAAKKIGEDGDAYKVLNVNVKGTESALMLARQRECKFVFSSTSDVYGTSSDLPFRESGNLELGASSAKRWAYAVSKLHAEHLVFAYAKEMNVPSVILRYFGAFSERSSFSWSGGHIPLFIDAILSDEEVIIHGDGEQTRCMSHVSDIVRGTISAMRTSEALGQVINLGNTEEYSVLQTAKMIHHLAKTGKELKIRFVSMSSIFGDYKDIQRRVPDLSKAKNILNYKVQVTFKDALLRTIEQRKKALQKE